jgi:hypothetical protein
MEVNIKNNIAILLLFIILGAVIFPVTSLAFVQEYQYSDDNLAGFFSGIWDGLLAPYSLVARWFISDVVMYAIPNTGWFYDLGFLLGIGGSWTPIGWMAAIISTIGHIFFYH